MANDFEAIRIVAPLRTKDGPGYCDTSADYIPGLSAQRQAEELALAVLGRPHGVDYALRTGDPNSFAFLMRPRECAGLPLSELPELFSRDPELFTAVQAILELRKPREARTARVY